MARGGMRSLSRNAAPNSASSGAMNASAIACAIGTRASPQKNITAITDDTDPRIRWTRITARDGQPLPRRQIDQPGEDDPRQRAPEQAS